MTGTSGSSPATATPKDANDPPAPTPVAAPQNVLPVWSPDGTRIAFANFTESFSTSIDPDDQVLVISGKDAGKSGRVVRTEPKRRRVFVEGLNIVKRHERPRSTGDMATANPGGIVEKEGPIHVSNVMLLDPKNNKPTRIGMRRDKGGKRERFAKRSGVSL